VSLPDTDVEDPDLEVPEVPEVAFPYWSEAEEKAAHRFVIFHQDVLRTRRPVVAPNGQLRYWETFCGQISTGRNQTRECPHGPGCAFAHSQEESAFHPARFKTELCKDESEHDADQCPYAHGEADLRRHAPSRYGYTENTGYVPPQVPKRRFCFSFSQSGACRYEKMCLFAHDRKDLTVATCTEAEEKLDGDAQFWSYRYKVHWCPIGLPHDWSVCVYAHNFQDARRDPRIGYGAPACPHWVRKSAEGKDLEYTARCPNGFACAFSHGAKERLYHPSVFRTSKCEFSRSKCPRGQLCAFYHDDKQRIPAPKAKEQREVVQESDMQFLQPDFLMPPFGPEPPDEWGMEMDGGMMVDGGSVAFITAGGWHGEPEMGTQGPTNGTQQIEIGSSFTFDPNREIAEFHPSGMNFDLYMENGEAQFIINGNSSDNGPPGLTLNGDAIGQLVDEDYEEKTSKLFAEFAFPKPESLTPAVQE
jgi:hypothetical protein